MKKRTFCIFLIFLVIFSLFTNVYARQCSVLFIKNGNMKSTYSYGILNRVFMSSSDELYKIRIYDFEKKELITLSSERGVYVNGLYINATDSKYLYDLFLEGYEGYTPGTVVIKYRTFPENSNICYSLDYPAPTKIFDNVIFNNSKNSMGNFRLNSKINITDMTRGSDSNLSIYSSKTIALVDNATYSGEIYNNKYLVIRDGELNTQTLLSDYKYGLLTKVFNGIDNSVKIFNPINNSYNNFEIASAELWTELYNSFFDENGNQIATPFIKYQTLLNDDVCYSVEYISPSETSENAIYNRKSNTIGNLKLNKNTIIIDMTKNTLSNSNLLIDNNLYDYKLYNDKYLIIDSGVMKTRIFASNYRYGIITRVFYCHTYGEYKFSIYDFSDKNYYSLFPGINNGLYVNGTHNSAPEFYNSFYSENGNNEAKIVRYRTISNNDDTIYSLDYITTVDSFKNALYSDSNNTIGNLQLNNDMVIVGAKPSSSKAKLLTADLSSGDDLFEGSLINNNLYTGELYYIDDNIYDLSCSFYNDFYNDKTYAVNVIISNNTSEYKSGTVYAAVYNKAGRLKHVATKAFKLDEYLDSLTEIQITNYSVENDDYIKIFTWDNAMTPQCASLTYNITN